MDRKDYDSILFRGYIFFEKFKKMVDKDYNPILASNTLTEALNDIDTYISLCPDLEEGYLYKSKILKEIGEVSQAKIVCNRGINKSGPKNESLVSLMTELECLKDYDEVEEMKNIIESNIPDDFCKNHNENHKACSAKAKKKQQITTECMNCGKSSAKLYQCGGCKVISYCGNE